MGRRLSVAARVLGALILVVIVALAVFVFVDRILSEEEASGTPRSATARARHDDIES